MMSFNSGGKLPRQDSIPLIIRGMQDRIRALEMLTNAGAVGGGASGPAGGDLKGNYPNPSVVTINGRAVTAVVFTDDTRLSNSRTPTAHAGTHEVGGNDEILGLTDAQIAAANKDGTAATPSMRTLGAGAQQAAAGTDARITGAAQKANNLSDLANAATARQNLFFTYPISAYRSAAFTTGANAWTAIPIDTLRAGWTDPNAYVVGGASGWYNVPVAGLYLVIGEVATQSTAANHMLVGGIYKNGALASWGAGMASYASGDYLSSSIVDIVKCAANDHIQLACYTNVALALTVGATTNFLTVMRVG